MDRPPIGLFVVVITEKNIEKQLTFRFSNYINAWRVLKGVAANVYRNELKKLEPIAANDQFKIYKESPYITLFCRYAAESSDNLQHLYFDLDTVIIEAICKLDSYFILCLGEGVL